VSFTPYDAATNTLTRSRGLLKASRRTATPELEVSVRIDIRRLSTVLAVAALDAYLHRLIVDRVYVHKELPGGLATLDVTFGLLLAKADAAKEAARSPTYDSRPRVAVKRQLRDRLLRETFQSYRDVQRALGMAGKSGTWKAIGAQMTPTRTPEQIRDRLNGIVQRRNQIVHEGDYRRLERPQNSRRNAMTYSEAKGAIEFIAQLIGAIDSVV
jgi:hypothetical protein